MKCERCGISCMDAEDYRDHLPCPGSVKERQAARISVLEAENAKLVELVKRWEQAYGKCSSVSDDTRTFLASIGGEGKR